MAIGICFEKKALKGISLGVLLWLCLVNTQAVSAEEVERLSTPQHRPTPAFFVIADTGNHWVFACTPDGRLVWSIGQRGKLGEIGEGLLGHPGFAQLWQSQSLVISDSSQGVIAEYTLAEQKLVTTIHLLDSSQSDLLPEIRSAFKLGDGHFIYTDSSQHWVVELAAYESSSSASSNQSLGHRPQELAAAWSFGSRGEAGKHERLFGPTWAEPLANGNVLIADSLNGRVLEVDIHKNVVRQHGQEGLVTSELTLVEPTCVRYLSNGRYLICDPGQGKVLQVDGSGSTVWRLSTVTIDGAEVSLKRPVHAMELPTGNFLITDSLLDDIFEVDSHGVVIWSYRQTQTKAKDLLPLSMPSMAIAVY